jgi:hypothetical protein
LADNASPKAASWGRCGGSGGCHAAAKSVAVSSSGEFGCSSGGIGSGSGDGGGKGEGNGVSNDGGGGGGGEGCGCGGGGGIYGWRWGEK